MKLSDFAEKKLIEKGWNEFDSTTGSLYYTYHNLKPRDLEFFKSLPYKKSLNWKVYCRLPYAMVRLGR